MYLRYQALPHCILHYLLGYVAVRFWRVICSFIWGYSNFHLIVACQFVFNESVQFSLQCLRRCPNLLLSFPLAVAVVYWFAQMFWQEVWIFLSCSGLFSLIHPPQPGRISPHSPSFIFLLISLPGACSISCCLHLCHFTSALPFQLGTVLLVLCCCFS